MIRFIAGFVILLGVTGSLETDVISLRDGVMWAATGLALMLWSLPKIIEKNS